MTFFKCLPSRFPPLRFFIRLLVVFLLASLSGLVLTKAVIGQANSSCQDVSDYKDLDGNGQIDTMILGCQFSTEGNDRLTIIKQSGEMNIGENWRKNITYTDEIWIFDHGTQGKASLIIEFLQEQDGLAAEIYDDRNEDGEVTYTLTGKSVQITENRFWTVRVVAPDGWWLRDGIPNYNLNIWVDGDVEAMFMMETYRNSLILDGEPDYEIQIYDQNNNGRPENDRRMILTPWLQDAVGLGTQMMANFNDNEIPITGGFDLWPYLDLNHNYDGGGSRVVKDYGISSPPIKFELTTGRIEAVGEFVASRGGENQCFYYSENPWSLENINESNFESPFCFYDIAKDHDEIPELQLRSVYSYPYDKIFLKGSSEYPYQLVRYSWDQENIGSWHYAVGLIGRHLVDNATNLAGYDVLTVAYEDFPTWITEKAWDMAVFSEFTGNKYFTSEGMYNVSYIEDEEFSEYFTGFSNTKPDPDYVPEANFRMEWSIDHGNQPYLYFSPIDHRLHLLDADGGTWQISESEAIHYQNLGSGEMINQWTHSLHGQVKKMMFTYSDFSVYFEDGNLSIWSSTSQNPMFTTLPPTDHNTWLELGKKLDQNQPEFEPDDFTSMLEQFGSMKAEIEGGTIQDLRITEDGFRFILNLDEAFKVLKADLLGARGLKPGLYLVTYEDEFHIQPFTPVNLEINLGEKAERFYTKLKSSIPVVLQNNGIEDAHNVTVSSIIHSPDGILSWSQEKVIDVLAGEEKIIQIPFSPEVPGNWEITVTATRLYDYVPYWKDRFNQELSVTVYPALDTTLSQDMTAFGVIQPWQLIAMFTILLLIVLLSAWLFSHQLWIRTIHAPASSHPDEQL